MRKDELKIPVDYVNIRMRRDVAQALLNTAPPIEILERGPAAALEFYHNLKKALNTP